MKKNIIQSSLKYEIYSVLMKELSLKEIYVSDNGNHFQIIAIGELFEGISSVKRQQSIYTPLMKYITDNRIHSLSIKTYTPKEWENNCKIKSFKPYI